MTLPPGGPGRGMLLATIGFRVKPHKRAEVRHPREAASDEREDKEDCLMARLSHHANDHSRRDRYLIKSSLICHRNQEQDHSEDDKGEVDLNNRDVCPKAVHQSKRATNRVRVTRGNELKGANS